MVRLTFGRCRPRPGQPCPLCGKPVRLVQGLKLIPGGDPEDWILCTGAPRCIYGRLVSPRERLTIARAPRSRADS